MKLMNFINIKTPSNIYIWWNFGSMIFSFMIVQIISGIMLSMNFMIKNNPYDSSLMIFMNINYGWIMRLIHSNLTSFIFIMLLIHLSRTLMFKSFYFLKLWVTGMTMLIMFMLESFIGYSLICNQMSYWAMMVITNFISSIPFLGNKIIPILWGNFNINIIMINRFFTIHFIIPILILIMSLIHINILHLNKSNNPLGLNNKTDLIKLNPNSISKDLIMLMIMMMLILNLILINPFFFSNNDNFIEMNYFKTPSHIEPEWYFLFFYSILRSINSKLSGLIILLMSMIMMFMMPTFNTNKFQSFFPLNKLNSTMLITNIIMISFMSTKNVEYPYSYINKMLIYMFFIYFPASFYMNKFWKLF